MYIDLVQCGVRYSQQTAEEYICRRGLIIPDECVDGGLPPCPIVDPFHRGAIAVDFENLQNKERDPTDSTRWLIQYSLSGFDETGENTPTKLSVRMAMDILQSEV